MDKSWSISQKGIEVFRESAKFCGDGSDRFRNHENDQIFEKTIHGLKITQHIDAKNRHGVMLIEGTLWDSAGIPENEGKTAEEISEYGFRILEEGGLYNIFNFYPELKEYIENKEFFPYKKTESLQGITFVSGDDFLNMLDSLILSSKKEKK